MSTLVMVKSMPRPLTKEEDQQVREYILKNPKKTIPDLIEHFEPIFETPITQTCVTGIIVAMSMDGSLWPERKKPKKPKNSRVKHAKRS